MADFFSDSTTQTISAATTELVIHKKSPYLVVYAGRDTGKRFALRENGETTLGRGREIPVSVSMGLCFVVPREKADLEELIARADRALYDAKERGRNRVGCEDLTRQ